jgi:hypothetical protein
VSWEYHDEHVLKRTTGPHQSGEEYICISDIFEEHVKNLTNWKVGEALGKRFPGLLAAINSYK